MPKDQKTSEELAALGQQLRDTLDAGLSKEWNLLERPEAFARMFVKPGVPKYDLRNHDFEAAVSAYYGLVVEQWVDKYLKLHATLVRKEATSRDKALSLGRDSYVWSCAERVSKPESEPLDPETSKLFAGLFARFALDGVDPFEERPQQVKAFCLETQSRSYIIVLNESFGRWSLHIRRFWANMAEDMANDRAYHLMEYRDRKDLTLNDVIALAHQATEYYGDALPGVHYPQRPFLSTFLESDLLAGSTKAGVGLRYGDFRDRGYVLSFKNSSTRTEVDTGLACNFYDVDYVAVNLDCLMDQGDEDESEEDANGEQADGAATSN